ncbi:MAG TPA: transglycosylase family protein [Propionibacteriaceae bacterium]|nr:transglycosylase family protein [Propionibacteriaceae bacterium]
MKKATISLIAGAAAAAILATTGVSVASAQKSVDVNVDGQVTTVNTFGGTVADALSKAAVTVGEHDVVVPSPTTPLADGQSISVRYGREVTVTLDGKKMTVWTTATTVEDTLTTLGVREAGTKLSVDRSMTVGRQGLSFTAVSPKQVSVSVDKGTKTAASTDATVAEALATLGIKVGKDDRVKPALTSPVTEGMTITIQRVVITAENKWTAVPNKTVTTKDASLAKGTTKVIVAGSDGKLRTTWRVVTVDGKESERKAVTSEVTTEPVTRKVVVGTKVVAAAPSTSSSSSSSSSSSGAGINLANSAMWDRIAKCESGGNWSINTGNGYYGGLQFNLQTWRGVGGGDFASRPDLASRAEQITVANRLYAQRGLQPWGCGWAA